MAYPAATRPGTGNLNDAPIQLEADSAEISRDKRTVVYNGNVVVTQAEQRLDGDTVTVSYTAEDTVEHARVIGQPALWKRQETEAAQPHTGKAARIDYFVNENRLVLRGNAQISTDRGTLSGEEIEYNTVTGDAKVLSGEAEGDRVRVIFKPDSDSGGGQ